MGEVAELEAIRVGPISVSLDTYGFCEIRVEGNSDFSIMTVEHAEAACQAVYELCQGKKRPILIVNSGKTVVQVAPGVRETFANNPLIRSVRLAEALVISSLGSRIIVNIYLKINSRGIPGRAFVDEEKARNWLSQFLQ